MTCPGTYPTVLNGQVFYNDSTTVEYECLSGFSMSGSKRISCSAGVWQSTPSCNVIRQYDDVDVFPEWWFYVLAALLGLLVLALFLCLLLRYCCCCSCCNNNSWHRQRSTRVMTVEEAGEESSQVYFVPVRTSPPVKDSYFTTTTTTTNNNTNNNRTPKTRTTATDTDDILRKTRTKTTATNTDSSSSHLYESGPQRMMAYAGTPVAAWNGTPRPLDSYAWSDSRNTVGRLSSTNKAGQDSANYEIRSDGDLNEQPQRAKKPAKEVKAWLPHKNPVRNINTSTK